MPLHVTTSWIPPLFLALTAGLGCTGESFTTGGGGSAAGASAVGGSGAQGQGGEGKGGKGKGGDGSGGGFLGPGENCQWGDDSAPCLEDYYCDAPNCQSGKCVAIPQDVAPGPVTGVCGCDGMVYWNLETAAFYAMPAKNLIDQDGCGEGGIECQSASSCGDGDCAKSCGAAKGVCWRLPPECPDEPTVGVCGTGCTSVTPLCDAILSDEPFDHACG